MSSNVVSRRIYPAITLFISSLINLNYFPFFFLLLLLLYSFSFSSFLLILLIILSSALLFLLTTSSNSLVPTVARFVTIVCKPLHALIFGDRLVEHII